MAERTGRWRALVRRLPALVLGLIYGLFAWTLPGQLAETLSMAASQPLWLVLTVVFPTILFTFAHLALIAGRDGTSRWVDSVLVALPALAIAFALVAARPDWLSILPSLVALFALVLACHAAVPMLERQRAWLTPAVIAGAAVAYVGLAVATQFDPTGYPRAVGSTGILIIGLGLLSIGFAAIIRNGLVFVTVIAVALLSLAFDPPVYQVRRLPPGDEQPKAIFARAFLDWLDARADRESYRAAKRPYPVLIGTAAGGGIYAVAQSYGVFAGLSAYCPTFAQHLLAVVGVSGGAIGSALYGVERNDKSQTTDVTPCGGEVSISNPALGEDHLAAVLAALLFVDVPNAVLPFRFGTLDSAVVFELSFRNAGPSGLPGLDADFTATWRADGSAPIMNFVAANAVLGERFVLGQYPPILRESFTDWLGKYSTARTGALRVVTAAAISARFPWITPVAQLGMDVTENDRFTSVNGELVEQTGDANYRMLADGGYFENTGSETGYDLMMEIDGLKRMIDGCIDGSWFNCPAWLPRQDGQLCRIVIDPVFTMEVEWTGCDRHIFLGLVSTGGMMQSYPGTPFGIQAAEPISPIWGPIQIILRVYEGRSTLAYSRSSRDLSERSGFASGASGEVVDTGTYIFFLDGTETPLPLGWTLSTPTLHSLLELLVRPEMCREYEPREGETQEYANARSRLGCQARFLSQLFDL